MKLRAERRCGLKNFSIPFRILWRPQGAAAGDAIRGPEIALAHLAGAKSRQIRKSSHFARDTARIASPQSLQYALLVSLYHQIKSAGEGRGMGDKSGLESVPNSLTMDEEVQSSSPQLAMVK
jgi:hypothetical protein